MRILLLIFVLSISNAAYAEPRKKTLYKYYEIFPTSEKNLVREILKRSPIKDKGKKFAGSTEWHVNWKARTRNRSSLCKFIEVNTSLKVVYTMPKIARGHKVTRPVRRAFDKYYASLLAHENEHMRSGLYAAREIEKALINIGAFKRCKKLEDAAHRTAKKIVKKYNKRDKDFDRKTNHGQK